MSVGRRNNGGGGGGGVVRCVRGVFAVGNGFRRDQVIVGIWGDAVSPPTSCSPVSFTPVSFTLI